jgi:PIN domain nuclease of toxin-antitoxin system
VHLLLDAHTVIWWLDGDRRLSQEACRAVENAEQALAGAGALVEIAIKRSLGKLDTDDSWPEQAQAAFEVMPISWAHIARLQNLPFPKVGGREHRDPFDRLLAAQALVERIPVISRDPAFAAYGVATIW